MPILITIITALLSGKKDKPHKGKKGIMTVSVCGYEPIPDGCYESDYDEEEDIVHQNELIDEFEERQIEAYVWGY